MFQLKIFKEKNKKTSNKYNKFFYFLSLSVFRAISWKSGHEGQKKSS